MNNLFNKFSESYYFLSNQNKFEHLILSIERNFERPTWDDSCQEIVPGQDVCFLINEKFHFQVLKSEVMYHYKK